MAKSLSFCPINNGVRFVDQYHAQEINAQQLITLFLYDWGGKRARGSPFGREDADA